MTEHPRQSDVEVRLGQVWRAWRRDETHRTVTIDDVSEFRVQVTRNTSRRTQSMLLTTLRKEYRLEREAQDA